MYKIIFLFLSFISGAVELGGIIYGIKHNFSVIEILGVGLAYQIGNLSPNPIRLNKFSTLLMSVASFALFLGYSVTTHYLWLFLAFVTIAFAIQSLRSLHKEQVGTTIKRTFRILGFMLSPLAGTYVNAAVAVCLTLIGFCTQWGERSARIQIHFPRLKFINWIMILHQIHYFTYAYFVIIHLNQLLYDKSKPVLLALFITASIFVLGWLTYISVPHIYKKKNYVQYFVIGHFSVSAILFLMSMSVEDPLFIVFWILTGFGGGTVYCIEKMNALTKQSSKQGLIFSENVGHILGVLVGITVFFFAPSKALPYQIASLFALITMVCMAIFGFLHRTTLITRNSTNTEVEMR